MRIAPNQTIIEGSVRRISPAADGIGVELDVEIGKGRPGKGFADYLQPKAGDTVTIFALEPPELTVDRPYVLTVTVNGGPQGERIVLQDAKAAKPSP